MPDRVTRKRAKAFPWLRAVAFAALVFGALQQMPFYPPVLVPVLALGVAALALFVPAVAVLGVVVALALPLMSANIGVGLAFLLLGLAASQFMGQDHARAFLVVGLAFAASMYDAGWALAVIAGFAFGASEGAILALLACLSLEAAGVVFGRETVGTLATGGSATGIVSFANATAGTVIVEGTEHTALGFGWLGPAFGALDIGGLLDSLGDVRDIALLIVQPLIWAVAASLTGATTRHPEDAKRVPMAFVAVIVGSAAILGASAAAMAATSGPVAARNLAIGGGLTLVLSLLYVAVSESVFPPQIIETVRRGSPSLHAEDADVDELLRVISTAEDALAAKHTVEATVLITDMKSFSAMTEMDGSILTAKTIQRHRDLLLPIVARNGGSGKSTGGDGLLAAFDRPGDAVTAAVEMQRGLVAFNDSHPAERPMSIRVGMAHGEVVVDKHGRPFIGDALNKAARIMDLGDGGQIYAEGTVMRMTPAPPPTYDHGPSAVKNIQEPLRVLEILWTDGLEPRPPRRAAPTPVEPEAEVSTIERDSDLPAGEAEATTESTPPPPPQTPEP